MSLEPRAICRDLGLGGKASLSRAWLGVCWVAVEDFEGTILTTIGTHNGDIIKVP